MKFSLLTPQTQSFIHFHCGTCINSAYGPFFGKYKSTEFTPAHSDFTVVAYEMQTSSYPLQQSIKREKAIICKQKFANYGTKCSLRTNQRLLFIAEFSLKYFVKISKPDPSRGSSSNYTRISYVVFHKKNLLLCFCAYSNHTQKEI